jgi:CheY-like chemotaxis protein
MNFSDHTTSTSPLQTACTPERYKARKSDEAQEKHLLLCPRHSTETTEQPAKSQCCSICGNPHEAEDMAQCPGLSAPVCLRCFSSETRCQNCLNTDQSCEGARLHGHSPPPAQAVSRQTGSQMPPLLLGSYTIIGILFAFLYAYDEEVTGSVYLHVFATIFVSLTLPFFIYAHFVLWAEHRLSKSRNIIQKLNQAFMQELEQYKTTNTPPQKPEYLTSARFQQETIMMNDKHSSEADTFLPPPGVLVVSDSYNTFDQLCSVLSSTGYTVLSAHNTEEALWHCKYSTPNCALIDAVSTDLKGFELGRHIKSISGCNHIPIIFMIKRANEEQIVRCYENGGADYVGKPPHIPEVLTRLTAQLELAKLAKTTRENEPPIQREIPLRDIRAG